MLPHGCSWRILLIVSFLISVVAMIYSIVQTTALQDYFDQLKVSGRDADVYGMLLPGTIAVPIVLLILLSFETLLICLRAQRPKFFVLAPYFLLGLVFLLVVILSIGNVSLVSALFFGSLGWQEICSAAQGFARNSELEFLPAAFLDLNGLCNAQLVSNGRVNSPSASNFSSISLRIYTAQALLLLMAVFGLAILAATSQSTYAQEALEQNRGEEGVALSPIKHPKSPEHQKMMDGSDSFE